MAGWMYKPTKHWKLLIIKYVLLSLILNDYSSIKLSINTCFNHKIPWSLNVFGWLTTVYIDKYWILSYCKFFKFSIEIKSLKLKKLYPYLLYKNRIKIQLF